MRGTKAKQVLKKEQRSCGDQDSESKMNSLLMRHIFIVTISDLRHGKQSDIDSLYNMHHIIMVIAFDLYRFVPFVWHTRATSQTRRRGGRERHHYNR